MKKFRPAIHVHEYTVYYRRNPTVESLLHGEEPRNLGHFLSEWTEVARIFAKSLDDLFRVMQGEVWSPHGEAREHIKKLGLSHTSMSVGDIVRDDLGNYYVCKPVGWKRFNLL
mgnify:CR=1 FL=1